MTDLDKALAAARGKAVAWVDRRELAVIRPHFNTRAVLYGKDSGEDTVPLFAAPPAAAVPDMATIRGAVARGWCHKETEGKEMDVTLAECIAVEVRALLAAALAERNKEQPR